MRDAPPRPVVFVKVSVATVTYNHERFLAQALESALEQRTDFPFEIVVSEDCSTDRTRAIAQKYAREHSGRIRLLTNDSNLGLTRNMAETLAACRGEYIAILEGDDYWTDPEKLQRQADYLDANRDCAWCFTRAIVVDQHGAPVEVPAAVRTVRPKYTLAEYLERQFQPRFCTVMFRHHLFARFPDWYFRMPTADLPLHVLNAEAGGGIGFIDEPMAAYRIHEGGVWSQGVTPVDWFKQSPGQMAKLATRFSHLVELYQAVDQHFGGAHRKIVRTQIARFASQACWINKALGDRAAARRNAWTAIRAQVSIGKVPKPGLFLAALGSWLPPGRRWGVDRLSRRPIAE